MSRRWWVVERGERTVLALAGLVVLGSALILLIRLL
jgi:hypothetical protein